MIAKFRRTIQLGRYLGPKWLVYRVGYAFRQRSGLLRRKMPALAWDRQPLESFLIDPRLAIPKALWAYRRNQAPAFFFTAEQREQYGDILRTWDSEALGPQTLADRLLVGEWRFFERLWFDIGTPPDWHRNALTGERAPSDQHWSQIPDFGFGDIKVIWEPNRFGCVYALVRAYWRTGDERYPELFWQLVEDWRQHNPPQQGPNWKCGQEISFRVMAWIFGLYGFADAAATTAERITSLVQMIAISGQRIAANLGFALSQRNNHGISEGMGLWTIGLLFPEFKRSEIWREKGRQVMERLGRDLIYDDGSFVQHSANYHRLMLHDYLWALRLGEVNHFPFSSKVYDAFGKAADFLYSLQDSYTGHVPNYGANDGSLILPTNNCDSLDYRPVLQASYYLIHETRLYNEGPWDEDLLWFFGLKALEATPHSKTRSSFFALQGGYAVLRGQQSFAMMRCGTHFDRPGHADMLHLDMWWRGINVACDAGSFLYNAASPWDTAFKLTQFHNTVEIDRTDQLTWLSHFLAIDWTKGKLRSFSTASSEGDLEYVEGEHYGYYRLEEGLIHRRAVVRAGENLWVVIDDLLGKGPHTYRLHWLVPLFKYTSLPQDHALAFETPQGPFTMYLLTSQHKEASFDVVQGRENMAPRGWRSEYYSVREPALSLAFQVSGHATQRFLTVFAFGLDHDTLRLNWRPPLELIVERRQEQLTILLLPPDKMRECIVKQLQYNSSAGEARLAPLIMGKRLSDPVMRE